MAVQSLKPAGVAITNFARGFGGYKPEDEKSVRTAKVSGNNIHQKLIKAWTKICIKPEDVERVLRCGVKDCIVEEIAKLIRNISYSAEDIERFSIALAGFEEEQFFAIKAGLFLSALINNGKDPAYTLRLEHLNTKINGVGFKNTKRIVVYGNLGDEAGSNMAAGELIIHGNTRHAVGWWMNGGCIEVERDAGRDVGLGAKNGEIHLTGTYKSIAEKYDGDNAKIYHKGIEVQPKPKTDKDTLEELLSSIDEDD